MSKLIPVIVKKDRRTSPFKYVGGVLNPAAVYYVRRVQGQDKKALVSTLKAIAEGLA